MWLEMKKWFRGLTPEEAYINGRNLVKEELAKLFHLANGQFNTTETHKEFDRGVNDELKEIGYRGP